MIHPRHWLDARYQATGAESHRMAATRGLIAVALTALAGFAVSWTVALIWLAALFAGEGWALSVTRPMARGPVSSNHLWAYFWASNVGVPIWTCYGLILWTGPTEACGFGAVAFWCGQLLYAQNFCTRSPIAAIQAGVPSVIAPLLIPLILPRFHGMDQATVMAMLALCVAHAVNAGLDNLNTARKLEAATEELLAGKQAAEEAQSAMAAAKAEADAANLAKSAFLATMSHEIRTPLNGVLGMAQAMSMDRLSRTQRERLQVVRESGEALLAILNDVLDLSKIEAGKLSLEIIDFDLGEVVRSAGKAFTALAETKRLAFKIDLAGAEGVYRGDPTRLRQVLLNLISNALKFTEKGGIAIRATRTDDGRLSLAVSDTGEGIAADALASLFAKFTQADASTTRRFGGTGLGLAICQELAQLMGGSIGVTSVLGEGSIFTLTIDAMRIGDARPAKPEADYESAASEMPALKVLAAEDNRTNQLVLKTLLAHAGIEPTLVENGAEAVEAWETEAWDLILMDVSMPVMDGPTATREIRIREAARGRPRTPIIALTANAMSHQITEYLVAGMDGHVAKPIDAGSLFAALQQALEPAESAPRARIA